jgi:methionine salvage enolase-phosphatase E1
MLFMFVIENIKITVIDFSFVSDTLFYNARYEQAEVVEHELQHMTEQVKSIIQTMNATQVTVKFS